MNLDKPGIPNHQAAYKHYHRIEYEYKAPTPDAARFMSQSIESAGRANLAMLRRLNALLLLSYAPTLDKPSLRRMAYTIGNLLNDE